MSHLLENNSTNKPLLANEVFLGSPVLIDSNQITASVSFTTDVPGQLEFLHSQNGRDFFNFEDIFQYYGDSHNRQVSLKGLYIRIKYTNGPINQTSFLLFTRLLTTQNDDMNVNVNYQHDSILCYANEGGFDIRSLTSNLDSVSVPAIEACITGTSLNVNITNQSGLNNVNLFDGYGNPISSNEGALNVNASITVPHLNYTTDSVSIGGTLPALTFAHDAVNVSGSSVSVSGSVSVSNQLSNYASASNQITGNNLLTDIKNKTINSNTDSITVWAGGENGLNIRNLSATVDNVDVGLGTYTWSNRDPPFPASRDVLSVQLCGTDNLAGDNLINLVSNTEGALKVETGLTSIFINNPSLIVETGLTSIFVNNQSLTVETGLTHLYTTIDNPYLTVETGLTSIFINNQSLTVETGLTSIFVNNQSLTVETGLTSIFVNNQINNYALETGGNLASIKANSDKFVFSGNNLNTVVANFPSQQNVWVDNQISGYAMETGGNLASIASNTSTTNTKIDGTNTRLDTVNNNLVYINSGLTTINNTITNKHLSSTNDSVSAQISNTSLDVHCYASSNSSDWHHLKSDANGVLNVHSMLQDGAGNDLTSTAIGATRNLDTIATLYANNSGTKSAITSTNGSLNANITNSSIAVSGTVNIGNTVSVNANITNSTIATTQSASTSNTTINAVDWINTTTSQLACSRPVLGFLPNAGPMSLETRAFNRTYNPSDNAWNEMTSTTTSSGHYSLDCNLEGINRTSNALNTYSTNPTTTNFYNRTGISMYTIYPKKRILPWGGKNTTASANTMLGAPGGTLTYGNAFGIGIPRTHYIYLTASSGSGRIFYYSYVSSTDGTIKNGQITLSLNTWQTLAQTDIACMRAIRGITTAISGSDNLRIAINSASVANSYWYWDAYNYNPGVYVCPANCLAYVSNITFYASSGTDVALYINKNDGTEDTAFWYGQIIHQFFNASNFNTSAGSEGAIGGYVYPGQCIYWFSLNPTPNDKRICFPIVEYFDL